MVEPKADCRLEWIRQKDGGKPLSIDPATRTVTAEGGKIKADVLNIVPPMRAANVARTFGLTNDSGFCPIDRRTFESTKIPDVYVLATPQLQTPCPSPDIRPTRGKGLRTCSHRQGHADRHSGTGVVQHLLCACGRRLGAFRGRHVPYRRRQGSLAPTQGRAIRISALRVKNAWSPHAT